MQYSLSEVLLIIKEQLMTIPVEGKAVMTLANAVNNIDACLEALSQKQEGSEDSGDVHS